MRPEPVEGRSLWSLLPTDALIEIARFGSQDGLLSELDTRAVLRRLASVEITEATLASHLKTANVTPRAMQQLLSEREDVRACEFQASPRRAKSLTARRASLLTATVLIGRGE
jgi:hypothetical protein